MEWGLSRMMNTLVKTYVEQLDFRDMFRSQEYICLPHYKLLMQTAEESGYKSKAAKLCEDATALASNYVTSLRDDVHAFSNMFDYRNSGEDSMMSDEEKERAKDSIERTALWLTSRE